MKRWTGLLFLATALGGVSLPAQEYYWDRAEELGIRYQVIDRLERLPLRLGDSHPNLGARYEPSGVGDYLSGKHGRLAWRLEVYAFALLQPTTGAAAADAAPPPADDRVRQVHPGRRAAFARTFREFVENASKDPSHRQREFEPGSDGAEQRRGRTTYEWWEYTDTHSMSNGVETFDQIWYSCAAVYRVQEREVALVVSVPVRRGMRPERKHYNWARRMLLSVRQLDDDETGDETDDDDPIYRWADTEARRDAVDRARANIADLDGWDCFTTEHYIVLFSWPKPDKRREYEAKARDVAADMDRIRELYEEHYPPPDDMVFPYSVLRVCSTRDEFHKYGETRPGVAGWFSPVSKELVLFNDHQITKQVAFHEGWHQYADTYFAGVELQRWFDEGTGDWFGAFEWNGRRWVHGVNPMRKIGVKTQISTKTFVPLDEIVTWNRDKFYNPRRAANYYAQGYSIVDFLMRGDARAPGWDQSWGSILDTYRSTMLETRNPARAVERAFAGIDWDRFTKAWILWVKDY